MAAYYGMQVPCHSYRKGVCLRVYLSHPDTDQNDASYDIYRITKSSLSASPKTLVSGSVMIFQKSERVHPD